MRKIHPALLAAPFLTALTACAPATRLQNPQHWPEHWAGRTLYNTPTAFIYASSGAAAGEADRLVSDQTQEFETRHGRRPGKGLVVVTDRGDELFTTDVDALLALAAEGRLPPGLSKEQAERIVKANLAMFHGLASSLGVDVSRVQDIAALPLGREGAGRLVGLSGKQMADVGWAVALPTRSAFRKALWDVAPRFMERNLGIGRVAQVALAPLYPVAEARAVEEVTQQWRERLDETFQLADPELAKRVDLSEELAFEPGVEINGGPAPLQPGDRVLSVNGEPVYSVFDLLATFTAARKSGEAFEVVVLRDGEETTLTVPPKSRD